MVSLTSSSPNVRSYGLAPLDTTSTRKFSLLSQSFPATTTSLKLRSPEILCLFVLAASCAAVYSSSAFRFATSLSAVKPKSRDDVLRGWISSLIFFTGGFFLCVVLLLEGFATGFGPRPAEAASRASCLRRLSRLAMFAWRCFSYSLSSTGSFLTIFATQWLGEEGGMGIEANGSICSGAIIR